MGFLSNFALGHGQTDTRTEDIGPYKVCFADKNTPSFNPGGGGLDIYKHKFVSLHIQIYESLNNHQWIQARNGRGWVGYSNANIRIFVDTNMQICDSSNLQTFVSEFLTLPHFQSRRGVGKIFTYINLYVCIYKYTNLCRYQPMNSQYLAKDGRGVGRKFKCIHSYLCTYEYTNFCRCKDSNV